MSTLELLQIAEPRSSVKVARVLARRADPQSVAAMLEAAAGSDRNQKLVAYRALGSQAHAGLLESVAELLEQDWPDAFDPAMLKYLEALPPEQTLPRARAWLSAGRRARIVGEHILALHARPEDRDVVEAALSSALTEGAVYRACSMVEALGTIGDSRSSDLLVQAFESTPYAYARSLALEALAECRADALARLATEALWDCERRARQLGAELAPSGAPVGARLDELRDDEFEVEDVRSVARTRRP